MSLSVLLQVFILPILGAIADYSNLKKRMMLFFAVLGALCTIGLFFITGPLYVLGGLLFILANVAFGASIVFYNAFLPQIASEDQRDKVSSRGWALGYIGGGLLLLLNLILYQFSDKLGLDGALAVRISLASAGVWWLVFGYFAIKQLRERGAQRQLPAGETYLEGRLQAIGADAARDSQVSDDAALSHRLSALQRRRCKPSSSCRRCSARKSWAWTPAA